MKTILLPLKVRPTLRFAILLFIALLVTAAAYNRSRAASQRKLTDLPAVSLDQVERILVVSPHPDDETIGAGGLITAANSQGIEVRVAMLTNGDGQPLAPLTVEKRVKVRASDFVSMGTLRQGEALAAIQHLGLASEQVVFLGYPDRGLSTLWLQNWNKDCPYRALLTRSTHNPYTTAYRTEADYCGSGLLQDLQAMLADFLPDLVIIPHPNDDHPDHRAAANFTRLALALMKAQNPDYSPTILGYLVHYGYFPQPRNQRPGSPLLPPIPLSAPETSWFRLDQDSQQVQSKSAALHSHASQVRLLGSFLPSFVRTNELFVSIPIEDLAPLGYHSLPLNEDGVDGYPILDSSNESLRRLVFSGADLVGWQVGRIGDQLFLTANTRSQLLPGLQYRILLKTPDGQTLVYNLHSTEVSRAFRSFTAQINLAELGQPQVLGFAAEIRQGALLDSTGWSFLVLEESAGEVIDG